MILLDTQVLIWLRLGDPRLGRRARRLVEQAWSVGEAAVSTMTFWEVGMLTEKGRLDLGIEVASWRLELLSAGLVEVPPSGEIATLAGLLPGMHGDPADRMIAATAITLPDCTLLTADQLLLDWRGDLDRIDATT